MLYVAVEIEGNNIVIFFFQMNIGGINKKSYLLHWLVSDQEYIGVGNILSSVAIVECLRKIC